ncbi:bifunctional demethylmenaquinone methyltransferase/2-methoxy-6-polyprenyl-1,4-benzoquinol methylase UbiE [Sphingobacterium hungaricum]|uniref:Demethylmenaquinone methyltransferase n=1 Tax=Sphingobacterium hungaricum TaxID=2082723 RepID=A0A928UY53_9SPHI|nr:bifunctional demethylmenaquinone methyltransferase/2-methoxy-6-polyprenyl-1,4-benzoquinol methylase UbiE [Sphingobacterium hungaricum]MBE8715390.1 bifunctional demethylmenaquinone methyltransferase/2-methoxy-6-polyprenyl-1,4-benzoquinol methylase UbiE [Sphingobacterium hungaricum]
MTSNDTTTVKPYKGQEGAKKEQVADMFNNISKTYDFLNHFLSLGIDIIWRKKAIRSLKSSQPQLMLDVATGTGDFALESIKILNPKKIIGVDISQGMLDVAKEKIAKQGLQEQFEVHLGDSEQLNFDDNTFDAVTVAFGVRNFENLEKGISDICRVLKPGGRAIILEFSNPKGFPIKQLYNFYFHAVTPTIGKLFSKDSSAYEYLPESVANFPDGDNFAQIMKNAGFKSTKVRPQTFGICTIYEAVK